MPTKTTAHFAIFICNKQHFVQKGCFTRITKEEMELLLKDSNPLTLRKLAEDAGMKKKQIENIRELLAVACQAVKEGLADEYNVKQELKSIEIEVTAVNYDRQINKDKNSMPPFSNISKTLINEFYSNQNNISAFESFFKNKLESARENGQIEKDAQPSKDEIEQEKDHFAKTRIYYSLAQKQTGALSKEFWDKTSLSIKLQLVSFLTTLYSKRVLDEKTKITDVEIQDYIAQNPKFDRRAHKLKAEKILKRAKAGENFASLANLFSEDLENTNAETKRKQGGLYTNVVKGQFLTEFESAVLSLKPGQIYTNIVETNYGYHIIKLERKIERKGSDGKTEVIYDVRHILISTQVTDSSISEYPIALKEYVKTKLEKEKEKKILDKILLDNPVQVAEDFEIPKVTDEQIQKYIQETQNSQEEKN